MVRQCLYRIILLPLQYQELSQWEHNNEELRNTNGCYLFQHERCKLIETKTKLSGNLMTDWGLILR